MTIRRGSKARAGEGAYVTSSHASGIRHDVAPGTIATAGQGYVTWIGTSVRDWTVDGLAGDSWQLVGAWSEVEEVAANV